MKIRKRNVLILLGALILLAWWGQTAAASPMLAPAAPAVYDCNLATGIPTTECAALVALYNSAGGVGWTNKTGWLADNKPCSWYGVLCSQPTGVIDLLLPNNHLTGTLPTALGDLLSLQNLNLNSFTSTAQLTGTIPSQLGNLSSLVTLDLSGNQLNGAIPTTLGSLGNLQTLLLNNNSLTGTIPQLGNLVNLQNLNLSSNQLSGVIPSLSGLTSLKLLNLGFNKLTGPVPTSLGSLSGLQLIDLGDNNLSGMVPMQLGNAISLTQLYLTTDLTLSRNLPQSLRDLRLTDFWFDATALCEPRDGLLLGTGFQGWLAGIGNNPAGSLARTNVLCDPVASTVVISRNANSVALTWGDQSPNTGYEMHRSSTAPYFTPDSGTLLAPVPQPTAAWSDTTTSNTFTDANNYYYVVRSKFQDSKSGVAPWVNDLSADSTNRVGKFVFTLTPGS